MSPEVWNALLSRVEDRLVRAESMPSVVIPADKARFPKLLCLDQNKWIQLACVHYGKTVDAQASAALDAIRAATTKGTLVLPMMPSNVDEVTEPSDEGRRRRIATFLVGESRNFCWQHWSATGAAEAEYAIRKHILGEPAPRPVRPALIHWGIDQALAGRALHFPSEDKFLEVVVNQAMHEPEASIAALVHSLDRSTIKNLRALDSAGAVKVEAGRPANQSIAAADRRWFETFHLFERGSFAGTVHAVAAALGVRPDVFTAWRSHRESLLRLTGDMPTLDVEFALITGRDRNSQDKTQPNDFKDMTFLKQAVAYANIVVTENRWAHLANAEGVAERHGTRVMASLGALPAALRAEGCI
jgi:hypothetical protein